MFNFSHLFSQSLERKTGIWFGPQALTNALWRTLNNLEMDTLTVQWSQLTGTSNLHTEAITNGLNSQCTQPIITAATVGVAVGDALRVGVGLRGGAVMIWREETDVYFMVVPYLEKGGLVWQN